MNLMGKATLLLTTLFMVFLSSPLLIVASRSTAIGFDAENMMMHTNLSEERAEGEEKAAAVVEQVEGHQVVNVGTSSHGRNAPAGAAGAATGSSSSSSASARQVPTGPDPIHHHQSPIRH